jgi:hypothetical protein
MLEISEAEKLVSETTKLFEGFLSWVEKRVHDDSPELNSHLVVKR